jgi:chromosome partitioning protein
MSSPILTFFNNKGGVGKTSLLYHLAWIFAELHQRVVAVDLDPQANLTAAFLDEEQIETLWNENVSGSTIYQSLKPLAGFGEIVEPQLQKISTDLYLIPGDVNLSTYEETLSKEWSDSLGDNNLYRPMRILSSFWQVMQMAYQKVDADVILVDIGPNLGAINRSVLIATDYVMIPLGTDIFSLQGLKNLGPTLRSWNNQWKNRLDNWANSHETTEYQNLQLPQGKMQSIGYLCQQYGVRLNRPIKAYDKWANRIPVVYREYVLNKAEDTDIKPVADPHCLAIIKHYRSLIPMSQEHRTPIFKLTAADGAIGSHAIAVQGAKQDFKQLARVIADKMGMQL